MHTWIDFLPWCYALLVEKGHLGSLELEAKSARLGEKRGHVPEMIAARLGIPIQAVVDDSFLIVHFSPDGIRQKLQDTESTQRTLLTGPTADYAIYSHFIGFVYLDELVFGVLVFVLVGMPVRSKRNATMITKQEIYEIMKCIPFFSILFICFANLLCIGSSFQS